MVKPELEKLYERFASQGDVSALAEVFDRVAPDLSRLARQLVGDENTADDLVQETFLTAIEQPESFDRGKQLTPWLVGILVNRARYVRRATSRKLDPGMLTERLAPRPDAEAAQREHTLAVSAAVSELPSDLRVAVEARLAGVKTDDLADRLGVSRGAMRVRLHRGLQRLRQLLPAGLSTGFALGFIHSQGQAQVRARVLEMACRHPLAVGAKGVTALGIGSVWMTKKVLTTVIVAVLILTGIAIQSGDSRLDEPSPSEDETRTEVSALEPEVTTPVALEPTVQPSERGRVPIASTTQFVPMASGAGLGIRVTRGKSHGAAPGAKVTYWVGQEQQVKGRALNAIHNGIDKEIEKYAAYPVSIAWAPRQVDADLQGRARVELPAEHIVIHAELDGEIGYLFLENRLAMATSEALELHIETPSRTRVRVRDTLGNMRVDAPVSLRIEGVGAMATLRTDEAGVIGIGRILGLLSLFTDDVLADASMTSRETFEYSPDKVVPKHPKEPQAALNFDPAEAPDELLLVTLPMGSVRIELVDGAGAPARLGKPEASFNLQLGADEWDHLDRNAWRTQTSAAEYAFPSGASFSGDIREVHSSDEGAAFGGVVPGPLQPALVEKVVVEGVPNYRVVGRFVTPKGSAIPDQRCQIEASTRGWSMRGSSIKADGQGVFEFPVLTGLAANLARPGSALDMTFGGPPSTGFPSRKGSTSLKIEDGQTFLDMGDVTLVDEPHLASGLVVNDDGDPLIGVRVIAWGHILDAGAEQDNFGAEEALVSDAFRPSLTDTEGRFSLYGAAVTERIVVSAVKEGWVQVARPTLKVGGQAVALEMARVGKVSGSIMSSPGVPVERVYVSMVARSGPTEGAPIPSPMEGQGQRTNWASGTRVAPDGTWELGDLAGGHYDVQFELQGVGWARQNSGAAAADPIAIVTNVEIHAGMETLDPRLMSLAVDGDIEHFSLSVAGENGELLTGVTYIWTPVGVTRSLDDYYWTNPVLNGQAMVVARELPIDLIVEAKGYQTARLKSVSTNVEVILKPALPVTVHWPAGLVLPEGASIELTLWSQDHKGVGASGKPGEVERTAKFELENTGTYDGSVGLVWPDRKSGSSSLPEKYKVLDSKETQDIYFAITQDKIDTLVQSDERRRARAATVK